ncbi:MAG: hypothetical protein Q9219_002015 [cf. Caloplaca sp. 3 TL-2023]
MESPSKRRRLFGPDDSDITLHERRVQNHKKLKSVFESIFEKYSKDFSDVGDVIDLETGEIVVDNGHIVGMTDEKDPGNENEWSDEREDISSDYDRAKRQYRYIIPDSQDVESSDDDPLGMSEDVIRSTLSSFQAKARNAPKGRLSMFNQGRGASPSARRQSLGSAGKVDTQPECQDDSSVEEVWRAPPLPGDNIQMAPPSPFPFIQDDSESARSASPPGVSIWAPIRSRRRSRKPDTKAHSWTEDDNELLRYYKTSTNLTFERICQYFPGRTTESLRKQWQILTEREQLKKQCSPGNAWTDEENHLLHYYKISTSKTYVEIHDQIPRHSIGAIMVHWYKMRQSHDNTLRGTSTHPYNPSNHPKRYKMPVEDVPHSKKSSNQPSPIKNSHDVAERHPNSTEAEVAVPLITLGDLESDQSDPHPDDEPAGQERFPVGMVVPDSQGSEMAHHYRDRPLESQNCLQKMIPFPQHSDDEKALPRDFHPATMPPRPIEQPDSSVRKPWVGSNDDVIEIFSSPLSHTSCTGLKRRESGINNSYETDSDEHTHTDHVPNDNVILGTEDACSSEISSPTFEDRCTSKSMRVLVDLHNPPTDRNKETTLEERKRCHELTDTFKSTNDCQRPPAQSHSQITTADLESLPASKLSKSPAILSFENGLTGTSRSPAERSMLLKSDHEGSVSVDESMKIPVLSVNDSEEVMTSQPKSSSAVEQVEPVTEVSRSTQLPVGSVETNQKEPDATFNFPETATLSTEREEVHGKVDEPFGDALRKHSGAATTGCQRFYRVEISQPPSADTIPEPAVETVQYQHAEEGILNATDLPSEHDLFNAEDRKDNQRKQSEGSSLPSLDIEVEHYNIGQHTLDRSVGNVLDELSVGRRLQVDNGVEHTATPTPGCTVENSTTIADSSRMTLSDEPLPNHRHAPAVEDDEDDLQLLPEPTSTESLNRSAQRIHYGISHRSALRTGFQEMDISDDELSTPMRVSQRQIEMTPVRCLAATQQRAGYLP